MIYTNEKLIYDLKQIPTMQDYLKDNPPYQVLIDIVKSSIDFYAPRWQKATKEEKEKLINIYNKLCEDGLIKYKKFERRKYNERT